ncbi:MAG: hypothetical protein AAGN66_29450 [Acidobacteriota bacterium]
MIPERYPRTLVAFAVPLLAAFGLAAARPVAGQLPTLPLGDDFQVNTTGSGEQEDPSVATDFDGAFIVVWQSEGQDNSGAAIVGQRFDADGSQQGGEWVVNTTTVGPQTKPEVSMNDDAEFAVTWSGPNSASTGVFFQLYSDDGVAVGGELQLDPGSGTHVDPDVAINEDGQSLVVWAGPAPGDSTAIVGRYVNAAGVAVGSLFRVNSATLGEQTSPKVASYDEDGGYVVVWEGIDSSGRGIRYQLLDAFGNFVGQERGANTVPTGDQVDPVVAIRGDDDAMVDNGFVIVWQGPDGAMSNGIFAQFFDETGVSVGSRLEVSRDLGGTFEQSEPAVSIGDDGGFVITWRENPPPTAPPVAEGLWGDNDLGEAGAVQRGSPIFIRGRPYGSGGTGGGGNFTRGAGPVEGPIFTVNASGQEVSRPALAIEGQGDFTAIWQSQGLDGGGGGIFGRRFSRTGPIFADGFETGNVSAWSSVFP